MTTLLPGLTAGVIGAAIGVIGLIRTRPTWTHWAFCGGMLALSVECALGGLSSNATSPEEVILWERWRLLAASCVPGFWLLFSLTYSRTHLHATLHRHRAILVTAFAAVGLGLWTLVDRLGLQAVQATELRLGFPIGRGVFLIHLVLLLSAVMILSLMERTFRASTGTVRWRIKFLIISMVVLFGVRIYTSSQSLLFLSMVPSHEAPLRACALIIACFLMGWAFLRSDSFNMEIHPSGEVLRKSMTLLLTGIYLFTVGGLAKLVTLLGSYTSFPLESLLVLTSLVLLFIVLVSERLRQHLRGFVSRHFKRPYYDYRRVWMVFTEKASTLLSETELCRETAKLTAETFQVLSLTIWLIDENQQLVLGATTSLQGKNRITPTIDKAGISRLIDGMREHPYPIDLDLSDEPWVETLKSCNPDFFTGGGRLCMPLVAQNEVLGVMSLGDRVGERPFAIEDSDLLKCVGDQLAASLLSLQLSRKLLRAKELEAFQAMSAFFVHDLKNTAHSLSLLLQNLRNHFQDPAFREDAQRAVSNSVRHINDLIGRLSSLRQKIEVTVRDVDLNQLATAALGEMHLPPGEVTTRLESNLPPVLGDTEQMKKVITNLVLNAREASGKNPAVELSTELLGRWGVLCVRDQGCGMSQEFLSQFLFRPFRTTKKSGIGIGMYQSKAIVEAHQGKIEVESALGKGTTVRVMLPLKGKLRET